ncbi:THO complex subunit 3-like [Rutidosis leptorrhynchoides]|uniref:THO complex subunit 3-like n=1 Tax=Rutidosis leptorrhynchoides TaxID=125765 RepID=UPI003A99B962
MSYLFLFMNYEVLYLIDYVNSYADCIPMKETSSLIKNEPNVLVTSSCDDSIQLRWKGIFQRCFKGHDGPVTVLSDKLLGDEFGQVFASGGEDNTVRLWSMRSSGKQSQQDFKATLKGHEKPIVLLSVTGHNDSLLVSMSKDSKVRVWDASVSSSEKSSCVGTTSVVGVPVGMKCHDSLIYIAAGSTIEAVDLRTMKTSFKTSTTYQGKLYSFDINPSKFLACTGGLGRAMLWDIRKTTNTGGINAVFELDGHIGPVTHLHMDPYKIVTGGPQDSNVNIWEANNGNQANVLSCTKDESGCSAMAADEYRIVTAGNNQELRFRDFSNAVSSVSLNDGVTGSKLPLD